MTLEVKGHAVKIEGIEDYPIGLRVAHLNVKNRGKQ